MCALFLYLASMSTFEAATTKVPVMCWSYTDKTWCRTGLIQDGITSKVVPPPLSTVYQYSDLLSVQHMTVHNITPPPIT